MACKHCRKLHVKCVKLPEEKNCMLCKFRGMICEQHISRQGFRSDLQRTTSDVNDDDEESKLQRRVWSSPDLDASASSELSEFLADVCLEDLGIQPLTIYNIWLTVKTFNSYVCMSKMVKD